MDSSKQRKQNNEEAEHLARRMARCRARRQRRLEKTAEERETRLVFALNILPVLIQQLRKRVEQLLLKRLESRGETWKKSWAAQYNDSKYSSKKRKEASRSKLTPHFLCFSPQ